MPPGSQNGFIMTLGFPAHKVWGIVSKPFTFLFLVFPRQFKFEALPSGKVSLGDTVELRCTVNGTTQLTSIALLSRMRAQLNTKCVITSHAGFCSYTIESVQLWDIGKYDCIKIYSDGSCYTMTLAVRRTDDKRTVITIAPRMAPTIVTKNTREPSVMKFVNKSSEIEIVKLITTSSGQ